MIHSTDKILITGTAGFIGFHLADLLIKKGYKVVGIDNLNDYYDPKLKYARLNQHGVEAGEMEMNGIVRSTSYPNYRFLKADIADHNFIVDFIVSENFTYVVNLAAQPGVRYSLENPKAYTHSNIEGFLSILEGCRHAKVKHLVYASSSSVYGLNTSMPLSEDQPTEHPIALYGATKKANELMAHSYSHLFGLPTTGLRFFTVYGPWGRPDMALFLFADAIIKGQPIKVFNHGKMTRDFTYVDDIVAGIERVISKPAYSDPDWKSNHPESSTSSAPYRLFNIGNSNPVNLIDYIEALEQALGKTAIRDYMDLQPGDLTDTYAEMTKLKEWVDFKPATSVKEGVRKFAEWYEGYYQPKSSEKSNNEKKERV